MKKMTFLFALILSVTLLMSTNATASERKPAKPIKKETRTQQKTKKQAKPLDQICTDNRYIYTTCCDGAVMITGYVDFAYWCESGEVYNFNVFMVDGCGYGCA